MISQRDREAEIIMMDWYCVQTLLFFELLTDYVCLLGGSYEPGIVAEFPWLEFGTQNVFRETARDGNQMIGGLFDVCFYQS